MIKKLRKFLFGYWWHKWHYYKLISEDNKFVFYCRKCRICGMEQVKHTAYDIDYGSWRNVDLPWEHEWEHEYFKNATIYNPV